MTSENFVSTRDLVWFTPAVTGGKIAARIIGDIDYDAQSCTLEITATKNGTYPRGYVVRDVPRSRVYRRDNWATVTLAPKWLIHWLRLMPTVTEKLHHGNVRETRELSTVEFIAVVRREIDSMHAAPCVWSMRDSEGEWVAGYQATSRVETVLRWLVEHGNVSRGWHDWTVTNAK